MSRSLLSKLKASAPPVKYKKPRIYTVPQPTSFQYSMLIASGIMTAAVIYGAYASYKSGARAIFLQRYIIPQDEEYDLYLQMKQAQRAERIEAAIEAARSNTTEQVRANRINEDDSDGH